MCSRWFVPMSAACRHTSRTAPSAQRQSPHAPRALRKVRLHEYVDVFASLAGPKRPYLKLRPKLPRTAEGLTSVTVAEAEQVARAAAKGSSKSPRAPPLSLPPKALVEQAKAALSEHFLVGLTENMDGFLALLSVELRWQPQLMCLPYPCQLKRGEQCASSGFAKSLCI